MRIKFLFLTIICLITQVKAQDKYFRKSIYFDSDKFELKKDAKLVLDQIKDSIDVSLIVKAIIKGNTDNEGDSLYNILLSEKRVNSCIRLLKSIGIADSCFKQAAFGENKPLSENLTEQGKQKNRRVDILLVYRTIVPIAHIDTLPLPSIKDLYKLIDRKPQEYCINPKRDTLINGSQGSMVIIKAGTFKPAPDCKSNCVRFLLKEDFRKSDIVLDDLSTTSNGIALESQAMVFTDAKDCKNRPLQMQKGKELTIMTPADTIVPTSKLFAGQRTPHDSIMNWSLLKEGSIDGFRFADLLLCNEMRCKPSPGCDCRFVTCRIKRLDETIIGWFNTCKRRENKLFRQDLKLCKLNTRKNPGLSASRRTEIITKINLKKTKINEKFNTCGVQGGRIINDSKCTALDSLFEKYGVNNITDLFLINNKKLMDSLGVKTLQEFFDTMNKIRNREIAISQRKAMDAYGVQTMEALYDTLNKLKIARLEMGIVNGNIAFSDLNYYIFNTNTLGWSNCDIFAGLDRNKSVQIKVKLQADTNIDCKMVFKERRIILPASKTNNNFVFETVPEGVDVWIFVLKYYKGKAYLFIKEITTGEMNIHVDLQEQSIEELREKIKILDR